MRRAVALATAIAATALPLPAAARAAATLQGGRLAFFADTLGIVGRDGVRLRLADGTAASADAAYVDLRRNRIVLAGHARIAHDGAAAGADAIALALDDPRVDLLDVRTGAARTTRALGAPVAAPLDGERFAFPDLEDARAYIVARRADIVSRAGVRFTPAAFPTSAGALPVPSYLYTFATAAGFGATSLAGAVFDQPYGLFGTPSALTALHARWLGNGGALALQQHVVSGDDAYVVASLDAPLRGGGSRGLSAYRRLDPRSTATLSATSTPFGWGAQTTLTRAFGTAIGRLDAGLATGGFATAQLSLRTPERPLPGGASWSVLAELGVDALRGGALPQLPDAARWPLLWRHGVDLSLTSPILRAPFGSRLGASLDAKRTWYAFPHRRDDLAANATLSRTLSRSATLFLGYAADWSSDAYPTAQALFFPATVLPAIAPDGTPWPDRGAFSGAAMTRGASVALQLTPGTETSLRIGVTHHADFPQYHGYGLPRWEVRGEARFRPFRNVGLDVGRAYDFAWGGTHWVPRWTFAITP